MAILSFLAKSYAQNVFVYGNRTFEGVPTEYHKPAKDHAAAAYSVEVIKNAFDKGYITEAEYVETMQIKTPGWELPKPEPTEPIVVPEQPVEEATEQQPTEPEATPDTTEGEAAEA